MSSELPFRRIAILGTGLIGGSFALAVRREFPGTKIVGYDRPEITARAIALGAVHESAAGILDAVRGADLVYVAMPVGASIESLSGIGSGAAPGTLVTDACSTKTVICRAAATHFRSSARFLGGHPMAGKEQPGIERADADLFKAAPYALAALEDDSDSRVRKFAALVQAIGAMPVWTDPETHDWAVGIVSHLPQMISVALAGIVQDETDETGMPLKLAGPGLQDLLRLAGSPYSLWRDILLTNKDNISHALDRLAQAIDYLRMNLANKDLEGEFREANELYAALRKSR
ncbi:MAG TPA: prephenate dehydrogenase [Candidatus Acidoferrales bacterium]|nr:prephenate dehydrogenase [Candidatus Acidoferrales bacterium]